MVTDNAWSCCSKQARGGAWRCGFRLGKALSSLLDVSLRLTAAELRATVSYSPSIAMGRASVLVSLLPQWFTHNPANALV
jgi:hypothetical protein